MKYLLSLLLVACSAVPRGYHEPKDMELKDEVERLMKLCPIEGNLTVMEGPLATDDDYLGLTSRPNGKDFLMLLDDTMENRLQEEVVVHEWAHMMTWGTAGDFEEHGALWGVAYARCYRAIFEDEKEAQDD